MTVRTEDNIEVVKGLLESEKDRKPDQPGSSCRRNTLDLTKSSFHWIVKKDLGWKPYKIVRRHKISNSNAEMRLKMGNDLVHSRGFTEAKQSYDKVMVFCLLSGSGEKFWTFFLLTKQDC